MNLRGILSAALCLALVGCANLRLTEAGKTGYEIVKPVQPTEADNYAVNELSKFLREKTEADFSVVSPEQLSTGKKHIFVGLSAPVQEIVGKDPLASLKDQEYVTRSDGADIVLYGKGMLGNLYAVVDFMDNTLGRRWYSGRSISETPPTWKNGLGKPVFTVERDLVVKPFSRQGGFSFAYRIPTHDWMFDFHLQRGMNIFFDERVNPKAFSLKIMPVIGHSLFDYIPPSPKEQPRPNTFGWVAKKDYFLTNPEFFGMSPDGKRDLEHQLCFSNHGLRKELTKNVLEHIRILKADGQKRLLLSVSAMDTSPEFCFCPGCQELKNKYQANGGPFYDYLFELSQVVKEQHPDTMLHTLAYRLTQTQKPPIMPAGKVFPDNLVVQFANVQDNADVDWNSPVNRPSYDDLLAWGRLTPHLWTWYYPFNGMIERMVSDIRLMKKARVEGVFLEFAGQDCNAALNFTELQIYVYCKLLQDVDRDVPTLIQEFTDYQYGPAAPMARAYLCEMEQAWKISSADKALSAGTGYSRHLTGLTPATIRHWQESFDRMERLTADNIRLLQNVRRLRRGLDYRSLAEWNNLAKACPDYFSDYLVVIKRIGALPPWDVEKVADWETHIKIAGKEKPLPPPFGAMDKALLRRFVPSRTRGNPTMVMDADAAFGYGTVVNLPDKPFTFGFYQFDTKKSGPSGRLDSADITPGRYQLHKLGEVTVTPNCIVWFASSWLTSLQLGDRLYSPPAPDNDNRYDVYVSLKFDKPIPPTPKQIAENDKWSLDANAPYSVLCDQIIFVKKPPKQ